MCITSKRVATLARHHRLSATCGVGFASIQLCPVSTILAFLNELVDILLLLHNRIACFFLYSGLATKPVNESCNGKLFTLYDEALSLPADLASRAIQVMLVLRFDPNPVGTWKMAHRLVEASIFMHARRWRYPWHSD